MSDEPPTDIVDLAEEYLDSLDGDEETEGEAEEVRKNLEYWEEQVNEFEEGTAMHEMAVGERDECREKLEAINARGERREELRSELLKRASREFAPQGEWVKPAVVEGLSHAVLGQRQAQLLVGNYRLPRDIDDLSKRDMVDAAKTVQAVAGDAVGDDDRISGLWEALDTDTRRSITGVLAGHNGTLSADEISEELGEDGTNRPGSNIRKVRHAVDIQPYHSSSDGYTLSLAGRYAWTRYGPATPEPAMDDQEDVGVEAEGDNVESEEQFSVDEEIAETEADQSDTQQSGDTEKEVNLSNFEIRE